MLLVPPRWIDARRLIRVCAIIGVVLALASMSLSAFAQSSNTFTFMGSVTNKFQPLQHSWYTAIVGYAQRLFWALAAVDFGWTTITYVLDKNDLADMLGSLVRKMMTLCFFFALLKFSNQWIPMIIDSFTQIGQAAGGSASSTTPDGIVGKGYDLALGAFQAIHDLGALDAIAVVIPVGALAILIFLAFLFVAAQLLVTQIESFICIGAGVILLGFGGSRWTTDMASKYMQYAVATGLKLMVLYLIVGAGQALFGGLTIDPNNLINSCLTNAGSALIYTYLAIQIPAIASAMMSGSPSMTAGGMMGAAITAGAAMAGAGAAAAAGGMSAAKGAGGAAAGATGLAKALSAGVNSGLDLGKSGTALASHALGEMGAHGLGMAKGAIGDAVGGAKTNFAQAVDQSTGGKIASSIESTRGGSVAGVPAPQPAAGGPAGAPLGGADASNASQGVSGGASGSGAEAVQSGGQPVSPESGASPVSGGSPADAAQSSPNVPAPSGSSPSSAQPASSASSAPSAPSAPSGGATPSAGTSSAPASASPSNAGSASSSGSSNAASAPAPQSASSGASAANTGADTGSGSSVGSPAASPTTSASPSAGSGGDASTASLSGNGQSGNPSTPSRPDPLHKRIQDLQGYVPQDSAHAASVNIDLKHSQD
ncbi:P-type conjugative transfer protein TrbL [Paraburkholderia sacchari]|uniref:P-type conjugative transfer protein TrbL n=1 Tax=Paraburkholderia sacchari TaxID=159450 RepID=A0A8T6ZL01_9BURK|nr:P-type conjugative transfer protein TrbL [Paraburkholderia sacchari]NLP65501.1 P-type conjugative transfer protein TrbL [Paraburkholderia sacchari]NLP65586.1 P-type conjugative transfer protein TrbL [Paraburkholderia sacchari]